MGNSQNFLTWLDKWLKPVTRQSSYWNRCYQATVNGWSSYTFHSNCDGKGPSVTIIRVGKYIFGGYTSLSWTSKWHDQYHLITGVPSSSCESAMIILRNSGPEQNMRKEFLRKIKKNTVTIRKVRKCNKMSYVSSTVYNLVSLHISLLIHDGFREISWWKGTEK